MTLNQLWHFHRQPDVVALWRHWLGPVLPWLKPVRRRRLLALGACVIAVSDPLGKLHEWRQWLDFRPDFAGLGLMILTLALLVWGWYALARRFTTLPLFVRRHPQLCLHGSFWAWMVWVWTAAPHSPTLRTVVVGCAVAFPLLLWRLGYLLLTAQRGKMTGTAFRDHWFYLWPVWGGSNVPFGKGWDYLKSCEATDEETLARSQLSAFKLFLLAALCGLGQGVLDGLVFGEDNWYRRAVGGLTLGVGRARELITGGEPPLVWKSWVSIYAELFRSVLAWGSKGHVVIGYLRLGGFYVFRNTYKPLLAETVVEFWNRYYYYFKELLVHFFFFPVFTRYFKRSPRMRMGTAVFAAAFFGNWYYHVIGDPTFLQGDWARLWQESSPRLVYCFALALGIFVSMYREQRRPKDGWPRPVLRRAVSIFGVWTFFAVIHLWSTRMPASALDRLNFVLGLFGLG